ncbi:MAG: CHC2 zinc finger domain-containing protein [Chthoniobacteraceae bacterium]
MSKFVDFKAVKAAVSMLQVLEHYGVAGEFKHSGDNLSGACPLHDGQNPTQFRISIRKSCWHCFGRCNAGGNVLDFVARKESVALREAALMLCDWFQLPQGEGSSDHRNITTKKEVDVLPPEKAKTEALPEAEYKPNKPLGFELQHLDSNHSYLVERGVSQEALLEFGVGYCQKGSMTGRVVIPIHNSEGQLVAYAGRLPGIPGDETPKYKLPPGFRKAQELFNYHRAVRESHEQPLVIVEGFFDCIALWQAGIRRVVALMGSSLSHHQELLIVQATNPQSRIVVMLDEDEAGREARKEIIPRLAAYCFIHSFRFDHDGQQPDTLTTEQLAELRK